MLSDYEVLVSSTTIVNSSGITFVAILGIITKLVEFIIFLPIVVINFFIFLYNYLIISTYYVVVYVDFLTNSQVQLSSYLLNLITYSNLTMSPLTNLIDSTYSLILVIKYYFITTCWALVNFKATVLSNYLMVSYLKYPFFIFFGLFFFLTTF